MSNVIAGLDLATTSGLTFLKDGVYTASTFRAAVSKDIFEGAKALDANREGMIGRKFEDHLQCWLLENDVSYVGIEEPLPSNPERTRTSVDTSANFAGQALIKTKVPGATLSSIFRMYGLEFLAATVCDRLNIPAVFVHQATWRKAFIGNGRPKDPKKEAAAMCRRLGIEFSSADAAESVGVCWHLNNVLNPYGRRQAEDLFNAVK